MVAFPLTALVGYGINERHRHDAREAEQALVRLAQLTAADAAQSLGQIETTLTVLARRPMVRAMDPKRCDPVLREFRDLSERHANVNTTDRAGNVICGAIPPQPGAGVNVADREWFLAAMREARFAVGRPRVGPILGRWVVTAAYPVRGDDGAPVGTVSIAFDLQSWRPPTRHADFPPGTVALMIDAEGTVLARSDRAEERLGRSSRGIPAAEIALRQGSGVGRAAGLDGEDRVFGFHPVPRSGWIAIASMPAAQAFALSRRFALYSIALAALVLLAVAALALPVVKRIAAPLERVNTRLEERVHERTLQLEATNRDLEALNRELEAFSYSVSHDLRAPLRHILGYVDLLRKHILNPDPESTRCLQKISAAAENARALIAEILALAQVSRIELRFRPVELTDVVREALEECRPDTPGRAIAWTVGPLPVVQGDRTLLRRAFVNLVSNAVKFSRGRDEAAIEIGARASGHDEAVVHVKDNGVGFDMRHADRLFGVFQRLHGQDEFEGVGVGLATVQRIVMRHGGRIWAEAEPGRGATFYLALRTR